MAKSSNIKIKDMRTYIEDDYTIAYKKARKDLGPDLIIIEQKEIKVGGIFGIFSKKKLKITFGVESEETKPVNQNNKPKIGENEDILELLKKMAKEKEGIKEEQIQEKIINTGVYNPYNPLKNLKKEKKEDSEEKRNEPEILKENKMDDIKEKIKKEVAEELKKEMFREGVGISEEAPEISAKKGKFWDKLKDNDIDEEVIEDIEKYLKRNNIKESEYERGLKDYFYENIKVTGGLKDEKFVMLVGATGVGKTTSCAKIVANKWLREKKDVAFITADTYRMEAVSQLKAYANIMRIPVEVINKPEELSYAVEKFKDKDLVLMDTAGRSPKNSEQMEEIKYYSRANNMKLNIILVLSATAKLSVLYNTIDNFKSVGISSIIFTKIDETTGIGGLLSISKKYNIPVSYITNGQKVPDDIEDATKDRLTEIFIEGLK